MSLESRILCHLERRLGALEGLLYHLVNNDIKHIYSILKIMLGAIITIAAGIIVALFKHVF